MKLAARQQRIVEVCRNGIWLTISPIPIPIFIFITELRHVDSYSKGGSGISERKFHFHFITLMSFILFYFKGYLMCAKISDEYESSRTKLHVARCQIVIFHQKHDFPIFPRNDNVHEHNRFEWTNILSVNCRWIPKQVLRSWLNETPVYIPSLILLFRPTYYVDRNLLQVVLNSL